VPEQAGISATLHPGGALLIASGLQAAPPVRVDLCSQMRSPGDPRLLPLRLGYRFDDVKRWVAAEAKSRCATSCWWRIAAATPCRKSRSKARRAPTSPIRSANRCN
jgi:hypothetical protein